MTVSTNRRSLRAGVVTMSAFAALLLFVQSARAQGGGPTTTVIASNLAAPKQPTVGPDGWVYVALSGNSSPADPLLDGSPANKSGAVVKVSPTGTVSTVVSGLLSRFDEGSPIGPSGVAFWHGSLYVAQGIQDPLNAAAGSTLSSPVLKVVDGQTRTFTSFIALPNDPSIESEPDTNPFACAVGGDDTLYVSDGGENGVWRVNRDGDSHLIVQFPGDPTITGIAPLREGKWSKWESRPRSGERLVVCLFGNGRSGFANGNVQIVNEAGYHTLVPTGVITMPIAAAVSPEGKLYILQFATPNTNPGPPFAPGTGAIWSVSRTGTATKVLGGLNFPTGLCFAPDGTAYVTNNGIMPTGELLKVAGL